ncbi:hypothetical protein AKJ42_03640 [candidate division MSBL1 archaeon SCGC-AAA261C02]|uniref:dihydropteroate synthase n=1 Tax=candidate division MSBL1 archaeon SCGC-AAA261C02 TaxID=1698272 RepID=A0A133UY76_9EURY|nr:hypothetical protein AKJ42_03640 [candidate division MSBL1 archaeon SCGC-AAA261C02]
MVKRKFSGIPLGDEAPAVITGVINIAPETFYKESSVQNPQKAADRAEKMIEEGADIIDLGAMSTAPGVEPISLEEEKQRLLPVLEKVSERIDAPISIDTQRAEVAKIALESGGQMINDVSGFKYDSRMPSVVTDFDCPAVLMAAKQEPGDARKIEEVKQVLQESLDICDREGVDLEKIVIDPGIGFGKGVKWDLHILKNLHELKKLNHPVCVGISRKSFIGEVLDLKDPADRLWGSLGATAIAVMNGADMIRTHDPKETIHVVRVVEAIRGKVD